MHDSRRGEPGAVSLYEGVGELDVADVLETLGVDNVQAIGRGEVEFSCIFTDAHAYGDIHPSAHMSQEKLVYRCKGCGRSGTLLDLVGAALHYSPIEALRWLRQRYGDSYRPPEGGSIAAEMKKREERRGSSAARPLRRPSEDETIGPQGIFHTDWIGDSDVAQYMRARGFAPATLEDWGFGFDHWTNRVTIPIRNEAGYLVGFKGRSINPADHTRYLLLGDTEDRAPRFGVGYGFDMHDPTDVVFGLDRVIAFHQQTKPERRRVVIWEGELNAVACAQAGVVDTVAIGTTTITLEQQRLLRAYAEDAVLAYDSDLAGHASAWGWYDDKERWREGAVEKLAKHMRVLVVPEHEGDAASMNPSEIGPLIERAESWLQVAIA